MIDWSYKLRNSKRVTSATRLLLSICDKSCKVFEEIFLRNLLFLLGIVFNSGNFFHSDNLSKVFHHKKFHFSAGKRSSFDKLTGCWKVYFSACCLLNALQTYFSTLSMRKANLFAVKQLMKNESNEFHQ